MQKYSLAAAVALLPLASIGFSVPDASAAPGANGADRARVIVVYKDGQRGAAQRALAMAGAEVHHDLAEQRGYAVSVPAVAVEGLSHNPAIAYVEEDVKRYAFAADADGGDEQPYGIAAVQASPAAGVPLDNNAGNVTVCIIDSGLDIRHPDHETSYLGGKIKGYTDTRTGGWTQDSPATWSTDENSHGTHVAGTIAALNNSSGVVGVAPSGKLNLFIVKVFGASGWAFSSSLVDALNQCTTGRDTQFANTKLVVSMSLGGSLKSRTEDTAFASAYSKGTLSIAAAGNDGNSRVSYPAGYASVVSVAAVDENNVVASFSQYNSDVEIAAPGVAVLSTVPVGSGLAASVTVDKEYDAEPMDGSPKSSASGALVDCGLGGTTCSQASGKVCLIERGTYDFATKVQSCKAGSGVAAIIYNNTTGPLLGTLGTTVTSIPSVGITQADGLMLKSQAASSPPATVSVAASSYAKFDGTSMATPHVSAVAALVWGEQTACTNAQIRNALTLSAKDLAPTGRDVYTGYGLVQRKAALDYLVANPCSGGGGGGGGGGTKPGKGR